MCLPVIPCIVSDCNAIKIAAISRADLLTLELDKVNAHNTLENAQIALKRAMFSLASFSESG